MRLFRLLTLLPVIAGLALTPACGKPANTGDTGVDGGVDAGLSPSSNCAPKESRHQSYVPCGEKPTSASRMIVMGDSISAGYGTTNPNNASDTPYTELAYFDLLLANQNSVWPMETNTTISALFNDSSIQLVNVAVPGATTSSMISNPDQRQTIDSMLFSGGTTSVSGHTIVVITIGGNDLVSETEGDILSYDAAANAQDVQNAVSNLTSVITYLQDATKFPDGVSIYLSNVYDPSGGTGTISAQCAESLFGVDQSVSDPHAEDNLSAWASAYVSLGTSKGFAIIDARDGFLTHGTADSNTYFYTDCIHPNNAGHNELRRLFFEGVTQGAYVATDE